MFLKSINIKTYLDQYVIHRENECIVCTTYVHTFVTQSATRPRRVVVERSRTRPQSFANAPLFR